MPKEFLEAELKLLDSSFELTYVILENSIKSIIVPNEKVQIIYDDDFEVVSVDNFNISYIAFAEEYGMNYKQLDIKIDRLREFINDEITYKMILDMPSELVRKLSEN